MIFLRALSEWHFLCNRITAAYILVFVGLIVRLEIPDFFKICNGDKSISAG